VFQYLVVLNIETVELSGRILTATDMFFHLKYCLSMKPFDHHEAWEMKPRKLTIQEVERPESVIEDFFQFANLPELRACLWEGTKTLVTGTFNRLRPQERYNLVYFYEQIEKLIEVTHVIHERHSTSKSA